MANIKLSSSNHVLLTKLRYFDRETFIQALILLSKVNVFFLELINLGLNLLNGLILLIHLDHRLITNIHGSRSIV